MFKQKLTKMTAGSNALSDYKLTISKSRWEHLFPKLDKNLDEELRKSYRGGFTFLSPDYKEVNVENVVNLDVNSLYPSQMFTQKMPVRRTFVF